jgi:hypothetical protein
MKRRGEVKTDVLILVAAALLAAGVAMLWLTRRGEAEPQKDGQEETAKPGARRQEGAERPKRAARPKPARPAADDEEKSAPEEPEPAKDEEPEEEKDPKEKLVDDFDALTDVWRETDKEVGMDDIARFRDQFDKVPEDRKEECLHRALNLVPDENAMLLVGILLDKTQPRELTELVFNDILNRDEDVKKPILRELFKDRTHPCWADAAWILDVTGELPAKQKAEKEN